MVEKAAPKRPAAGAFPLKKSVKFGSSPQAGKSENNKLSLYVVPIPFHRNVDSVQFFVVELLVVEAFLCSDHLLKPASGRAYLGILFGLIREGKSTSTKHKPLLPAGEFNDQRLAT